MWMAIGWAATVLVAVVLGSWGAQQRADVAASADAIADLEARVAILESVANTVQARADGLVTEQARLIRWLARDDVTTVRLPATDDGVAAGSVLFLPDRRALVALRDPSGGTDDVTVWGEAADGTLTTLASFTSRTAEVDAAAFRALLLTRGAAAPGSDPGSAVIGRVEVP